jgi:hypothetical protein
MVNECRDKKNRKSIGGTKKTYSLRLCVGDFLMTPCVVFRTGFYRTLIAMINFNSCRYRFDSFETRYWFICVALANQKKKFIESSGLGDAHVD